MYFMYQLQTIDAKDVIDLVTCVCDSQRRLVLIDGALINDIGAYEDAVSKMISGILQ